MRLATGLLLMFVALPARAVDSGFYVGFTAGLANHDRDGAASNGIPDAPFGGGARSNPYRGPLSPPGADSFIEFSPIAGRTEDGGPAWRIVAGYRFTSRLGIEATWIDVAAKENRHEQHFNNRNVDFDFPAVEGHTIIDIDVPVHGATLSGTARWPATERLEVLARLGVLFWEADVDVTEARTEVTIVPEIPPTLTSRVIDRTGLMQHFGDDDGISPAFGLGVMYRVFERVYLRGDVDYFHDVTGDDVHTFQAGLIYEF